MPTISGTADDVGAFSVAILVRNEVLRRGIDAVLRSLPIVDTVRQCATSAAAAELFRSDQVDLLIVAAADAGWLETVRRPNAIAGTRVLLLVDESASNPLGYAAAGVDGFLAQQDLSAQTLCDALRRCRRGELPMPPALARALLAARADAPAPGRRMRAGTLTSREIEALTLLVKGLSNKQIARRLEISSHGAKRLVASIMVKLDSPNRTTAAVNAIKAGLVPDDAL